MFISQTPMNLSLILELEASVDFMTLLESNQESKLNVRRSFTSM
jgi:hypothetical protein